MSSLLSRAVCLLGTIAIPLLTLVPQTANAAKTSSNTSAHSAINSSANSGKCGRASWYALYSKTASGERMNPSAMTAAHRSLPMGSKIRVVNKANGKSVIVRINDRGPFIRGRVLDLSKGAARELGYVNAGHTAICYERIS